MEFKRKGENLSLTEPVINDEEKGLKHCVNCGYLVYYSCHCNASPKYGDNLIWPSPTKR